MKKRPLWRILLPVGMGTCLSLIGDSSLYTVLPTHTSVAGVSLASVGILLSANRFIRLLLNHPVGMAYDRWPRRPIFISALFIGAFSTLTYGFVRGFWPFLLGRLLWGLAWSGIWVGGNTIVLDIVDDGNRGRWIGIYHLSFFLGSSSGAILGGLLTDVLGFRPAMIIAASLTFLGALTAMVLLPETRFSFVDHASKKKKSKKSWSSTPDERGGLFSLTLLYSANRLVVAGVVMSTLGIFLRNQLGEQVQLGGTFIGVSTLTGVGLGSSTLIAMISAPLIGGISDRFRNRWRVAAGGLIPGIVGFIFLALGIPLTISLGIPLIATTSGSNQGLSTALIGDFGNRDRQSRRLGVLFTFGDLASAIGPLLAYALMPITGMSMVYGLSAGLFAIVFLVVVLQGKQRIQI